MTEQQGAVDPDLYRLRAEHGNLWHIRRSGSLWVATRRTDDGVEPTIIEDTPEKLGEHLANPGVWGQRAPRPRMHG